jgi:hypothetical protein
MSSIANSSRRPASVLALKLNEVAQGLETQLDHPDAVLEILVNCAAKGEPAEETWTRLHEAAQRHGKAAATSR